jgi:hypothetical protein
VEPAASVLAIAGVTDAPCGECDINGKLITMVLAGGSLGASTTTPAPRTLARMGRLRRWCLTAA